MKYKKIGNIITFEVKIVIEIKHINIYNLFNIYKNRLLGGDNYEFGQQYL